MNSEKAEGKVYVANALDDTVSVIDTTNNTKITDIKVGKEPVAIDAIEGKVYVANALDDTCLCN
jgi:YVTN family beta-propeller protein